MCVFVCEREIESMIVFWFEKVIMNLFRRDNDVDGLHVC